MTVVARRWSTAGFEEICPMKAIRILVFATVAAAFVPSPLPCDAAELDWISEELAKPVLGAGAAR